MEVSADSYGNYSSIYVDGQFVYMAVVVMVNLKILTSTNTHSIYSFFFSIGSIVVYIVFYWALNEYPGLDIYLTFSNVFKHNAFYFALLFCSLAIILVDIGLHRAHHKINKMLEFKEQH